MKIILLKQRSQIQVTESKLTKSANLTENDYAIGFDQ